MTRNRVTAIAILLSIGFAQGFLVRGASAQVAVNPENQKDPSNATTVTASSHASSIDDKRTRAKLLHETLHGALLVMHRDFFSEESSRVLPSQSLLSVFSELQRGHGVEVRWMTVSGDEMNADHRPVTEFELEAVSRIKQGAEFHEDFEEDVYRYVGRIRLASECLKCHVSRRTSTVERASGLIITIKSHADKADEDE